MLRISDITIRTKLMALVALPLAGLALFGYMASKTIDTVKVNGAIYGQIVSGKDLIADVLPPPLYIIEAQLLAHTIADTENKSELEEQAGTMDDLARVFDERIEFWRKELPEGRTRDLMMNQTTEPAHEYFQVAKSQLIPSARKGDLDGARTIVAEKLTPLYQANRKAVDEVVELVTAENQRVEKDAASMLTTERASLIGLGIGIAVATALVSWFMVARIVGSIREVIDAMTAVATGTGDLRQRLAAASGKTEIGQLCNAFNRFSERIGNIIKDARGVTEEVRSGTERIAAASEESSRATQLQSENVGQITTLVDELAGSAGSVADQAQTASKTANQAGDVAQEGQRVVGQTIESMRAIELAVTSGAASVENLGARSAEIGKIIGVIKDIADQTNLLALNAAIEAARAGEHGRGFAVVADEVRKLAERTTTATKEVTDAIKQIQQETADAVERMSGGKDQVKTGVELAASASEGLRRIVGTVTQTGELISRIAESVSRQAELGEDIRRNIGTIAASSSEVAEANGSTGAAAFQLSQKANSLHEVISRFALDRRGSGDEFRRISLPGQRCNLGRLVDLSVTGVQVEAENFRGDIGSAATVSFEHEGSAYRAEGKVRWVKGAGKFRRLGIQFDAPVERFRPLVANPDAILC